MQKWDANCLGILKEPNIADLSSENWGQWPRFQKTPMKLFCITGTNVLQINEDVHTWGRNITTI